MQVARRDVENKLNAQMKQCEDLLRSQAALENIYKKVKKDALELTGVRNKVMKEIDIERRENEVLRSQHEQQSMQSDEMK